MKKAISTFLSVLILASSSGIAYAQHFCGGMEMMAQITLGEKHLSCGMESGDLDSDCSEENSHSDDHDCCQNLITQVQIDDNFTKASFNLDLKKTFVATFVAVFTVQEVLITSEETNVFTDYNPPPLERDLNILYQTFLI